MQRGGGPTGEKDLALLLELEQASRLAFAAALHQPFKTLATLWHRAGDHLALLADAEHALEVVEPLPEALDRLADRHLELARASLVRRLSFIVRLDDAAR
jgi:hypothetical protein